MIVLEDVLQILVARTNVPSALGIQLERIEKKSHKPERPKNELDPWPYMYIHETAGTQTPDQEEEKMLRDVGPYRVIDTFCYLPNDHVVFDSRRGLRALAKKTGMSLGQIAVIVLRAFRERCTRVAGPPEEIERATPGRLAEERGLIAVAEWGHLAAPNLFRDPLKSRKRAAELYADSLLAISDWIERYNELYPKTVRYGGRDIAYERYCADRGILP